MEQRELVAASRNVLGKKVRFLRRQGITPANLYGHNIPSMALQVDTSLLESILARAGRHSLIPLRLDSGGPRTVVIHNTQRDPLTDKLLHVDLYQVEATEKMKAEIPLVLVGEAPATKLRRVALYQSLNELPVECFPKDLPPAIEVDLSQLVEPEQAIHVKDLPLGSGIEALVDAEEIVVRVVQTHEEVEEGAEEEATQDNSLI